MSLFGYEDTNQGYLPERHFVPRDKETRPNTRLIWFNALKQIEDNNGLEWKDRLDFYKEDGTKLGKFVQAGANTFYFWPEENYLQPAWQVSNYLNNDFTFGETHKNRVGVDDKIYYSDPDGTYKMLYDFIGGRRRRTRARRHKSRRSRRKARRTRRRRYYSY
jgi:hypothetical protein